MRESRLWFFHIMAGGCLVILLGLHTVVMHFDSILAAVGLDSGDALNYTQSVLPRMKSIVHTAIYLLLLCAGLYHGLYGLRSLIFELKFSTGAKKGISLLLLLTGLVVGAWGAYTILAGHLNPPANITAAIGG